MKFKSKRFSEEQVKEILLYYVSSIDKPVFYVFDTLPVEQWATLAWAYSRTHVDFRQRLINAIDEEDFNAEEILMAVRSRASNLNHNTQEKARRFIQKWVQDYWHNSLKELSHARICIEWVSDLVWKEITWRRLTSPIVKSSRYIDWTAVLNTSTFDEDIMRSKHAGLYQETLEHLHKAYTQCTEMISNYVCTSNKDYLEALLAESEDPEITQKAFDKACKWKSFDSSRYLLTASMPTSMAISMNVRTLEYMITRLLSNPLKEAQKIGQLLLDEWRNSVFPIFLWEKCHSKRDSSLINIEIGLQNFVKQNFKFELAWNYEITERVELMSPRTLDDKFIAGAIAYKYSNWSFAQVYNEIDNNPRFVDDILNLAYQDKDKFTATLREIEHNSAVSFETLMDYWWYRDIHRHRMWTITRQTLSTHHWYEIPSLVRESWCLDVFVEAMKKAKTAYDIISKELPNQAQFIVPFAYKYRTMYSWNLREIQYFIELRSMPQWHESYRSIAHDLNDLIAERFPSFAKNIKCNRENVPLGRLKDAIKYFKKKKESTI